MHNPMMLPNVWLTTAEAGKVLGVSTGTVSRLIRLSRLPAVRVAGHDMVTKANVAALKQAREKQ